MKEMKMSKPTISQIDALQDAVNAYSLSISLDKYSEIMTHTNAQTAPPLNRGSMTPRPWQGFQKGLAEGIKKLLFTEIHFSAKSTATKKAWQYAASKRRAFLMLFTLLVTFVAARFFIQIQPTYSNPWLQYGQIALFVALSAWIVMGFTTAIMGFWVLLRGDRHAMSSKSVEHTQLPSDVRTAIIMPICNEEVTTVFAGLHAIAESIAATGYGKAFDLFILSDSNNPKIIEAERRAWEQLRHALASHTKHVQVEVYYRLRTRRVHRKAGNVADFCRRWGKNYRYMIVLDADSIMSGNCVITLAKLMEANPSAGIIQTSTQAVGQVTVHARVQQFASRLVGRIFTLGMQYWQLGESHYFGHNAIIRVEPFMAHCALAPIKGKGGMAGDIMSHDFVEAALMRRAGYHVWMVADLEGSYEQQPSDLISELQRDRRWCQGNMQNIKLIAEPGIHSVHRAMLATGFMSYFSAPLWMLFLTLGTFLWFTLPDAQHAQLFTHEALSLWVWTLTILFMPRFLGVLAVFIKGEQRLYGGSIGLIQSLVLEALIALLQAPIRMVAHTVFVVTSLTGIKLEWKSPPREAATISWHNAMTHFALQVLVSASIVIFILYRDADGIMIWLSPVLIPLLLVIPIAVWTSQTSLGAAIRKRRWLLIPEEALSPEVLRSAYKHIRQMLQQQQSVVPHMVVA